MLCVCKRQRGLEEMYSLEGDEQHCVDNQSLNDCTIRRCSALKVLEWLLLGDCDRFADLFF